MVIEDVTRPPVPEKSTENPVDATAPGDGSAKHLSTHMGSPVDRLASVMADLIVLLPLLSLVTAPFRRQWELAQLLRDSDALVVAFSGLCFSAFLGTVLYQTLFVVLWGATPGKRLLGLRVISMWTGEKPVPKQAFLRSVFWCFETMLLGLPWVGVLSNERRRPWHDRVADTQVVATEPKRAVGVPDHRELTLASGVQAITLFAFTGFLFSLVMQGGRDRSGKSLVNAKFEDSGFLCSSVSEAHEEWLSAGGDAPTRVDVAIALHAADSINDRCLEAEAEYALWNGQATAAAYLAKSLARQDDSADYVAYTRKTCDVEPQGSSCRVARLLMGTGARASTSVGRLKPADTDEILAAMTPTTPVYVHVYLVKELIDENRFAEALKLIERGSAHRKLGYFYASHRSQALWGLHRQTEARLALRASLEGLSSSQRVRLSRWLCDVESASACTTEAAQSCGLLTQAVSKSPVELESNEIAVAWIRGQECVSGRAVDYKKMRNLAPGVEAQTLLDALAKLKENDREGARRGFELVVDESEEDSPFWFEAQSRLIALAENESELREIADRWKKSDSADTGWLRVGHLLLQRFEQFGQTTRMLEVGTRINEWDPFDADLSKRLVVWSYNTGDVRTAQRFLAKLKTPAVDSRAPASVAPVSGSDFDRIARELAAMPLPIVERSYLKEEPTQ